MYETIRDGMYWLRIPMENIYTSVYILTEKEECLILDSADRETDIEQYVLPALSKLGLKPSYLVCSHLHGDHCGGMQALIEAFPDATVGMFADKRLWDSANYHTFEDGEVVFGRYQMLNLKGHATEGLAVLDLHNKILFSGDCLQQYGIARWGTGVFCYKEYIKTIRRVEALPLQEIYASHDYIPMGCSAIGTEAIQEYLHQCEKAVEQVRTFVKKYRHLTDEQITEMYNTTYSYLPSIVRSTVTAMRERYE